MTQVSRLSLKRLPRAGAFILHRLKCRMVAGSVWRQSRGRVMSGPFKGMHYVRRSQGSEWVPKILGTYEQELEPIIENGLRRGYASITVVGGGEGYYAVGWAVRDRKASITCFERAPRGRRLLSELACKNNVSDRVRLLCNCTPELLSATLEGIGRPLIIIDVDGGEKLLLDPDRVAELSRADILVEVHDCFVPGVSQLLCRRFSATHDIVAIPATARRESDWPEEAQALKWVGYRLMSEQRPDGNSWLWMTTK